MEPSLSELPLRDELIARELARHYSHDRVTNSLDAALRAVARACWVRAGETLNPYEDETTARAHILRALDRAAKTGWEFREARRVFTKGRFVIPRTHRDPVNQRLSRTYSLMATCLWETAISDPARQCRADCERPGSCEAETDDTRTACARSFVYPYLREEPCQPQDGEPDRLMRVPNWKATATAIAVGLRGLHETRDLNYLPDVDAVRKALQRDSA
jgi:hypothetical protein